jgi:hypothetical protein
MPPKPVHIAQISDLHIRPPRALAYGRVDTARALERCVAALNDLNPQPDLVVISGDLADTPTAEEYEYLKRLLAPLKLPFAGIPGNHDAGELMRAAFPQAYAFSSGPLNQRVEVRELVSCCWIPACAANRMANSPRPPCNGSKQHFNPRRIGQRCYFCTIRRSRPAFGTWTARTSSMRANSRRSSRAIRVCSSLPPATSIVQP